VERHGGHGEVCRKTRLRLVPKHTSGRQDQSGEVGWHLQLGPAALERQLKLTDKKKKNRILEQSPERPAVRGGVFVSDAQRHERPSLDPRRLNPKRSTFVSLNFVHFWPRLDFIFYYGRGIDMIGNTYKIFGTDTVFEITGQGKSYWIISIRSAKGEALRVHIEKSALADGVRDKKLEKLEGVDA